MFSNIKTLNLYTKEDEYFQNQNIIKYIKWCNKGGYYKNRLTNTIYGKPIEYKGFIYRKEDREIDEKQMEKKTQKKKTKRNNLLNWIIPIGAVEIGKECFYNCCTLSIIQIPNTVTKLGDYSFDWCTNLSSITLSENMKEIGNKCFQHCYKLSSIQIPNSVTKLGNCCFNFCSNLSSIKLSENIKELGDNCFENCFSVKEITLPNTLKFIEESLCTNSKNITKITFGKSIDINIISKMNQMFNLKEIVIGNDYHFKGNRLFRIHNGILSSINLKSSITKINENVIKYTQLTSYTIPTNVTKLDDSCFANCKELTEIQGLEHVMEIGKNCFENF